MEIKQLSTDNTQQFCSLIIDMYSHLENLEWFTPMPYDFESVKGMIENPRFYIIGVFDNSTLCAVSCFDYKCGKLIGKVDLPQDCTLQNTVEIGFNIVHSSYQGKGIMKQMVSFLLEKAKKDNFKYVISKVHKDNFASFKSLLKNSFETYSSYTKPVNKQDFILLSSQPFFSTQGKINAQKTLAKYPDSATEIEVSYNIYIKK